LVRARAADGRAGFVRIGARLSGLEPASHRTEAGSRGREEELVELDPRHAVTLDFGSDGATTEAFATMAPEVCPPDLIEARLVVSASPNAVIEALAVVPLADELPLPPPEAWEPVAAPTH
jgi:hypothetical protein